MYNIETEHTYEKGSIVYERDFDSEFFTEDTIDDAVLELLDDCEIEDAMDNFDLIELFSHLDDEMKEKIIDCARRQILDSYFIKREVEDDAE